MAERTSDSVEMGVLAVRKHKSNGSAVPPLFAHRTEQTGGQVYKLSIRIEKIRPKPCPRSKKLALLAEARRSERIGAGVATDRATILPRKTAVCTICNEVCQSAQSLYLHKKKHHRSARICTICERNFETETTRKNHEKLGMVDDPVSPNKGHRLLGSLEKFDGETMSRNEKYEDTARRDRGRGAAASYYDGATFTCRVCRKDFSSAAATAEIRTKDAEHKCNMCEKLFEDDSSLNEHLADHLSRALRCPVCPKAFINRATLRIHMKSHGGAGEG